MSHVTAGARRPARYQLLNSSLEPPVAADRSASAPAPRAAASMSLPMTAAIIRRTSLSQSGSYQPNMSWGASAVELGSVNLPAAIALAASARADRVVHPPQQQQPTTQPDQHPAPQESPPLRPPRAPMTACVGHSPPAEPSMDLAQAWADAAWLPEAQSLAPLPPPMKDQF